MAIGRDSGAAVCMKKNGESQEFEQARFRDLLRLFQFASQTRTALPSGLPLGGLVRYFRRFAAAKRAGVALRRGKG